MKLPIFLRIYKGDQLVEVKQFTESQVVIGNSQEVQLVLQDAQVSPLHSTIEERNGQYFLSDLGSQAGTLRNGEKILEEQIASGDKIGIGPFTVHFFVGVPKVEAPKVAATPPPIPDEAPAQEVKVAPVSAPAPTPAQAAPVSQVSSGGSAPSTIAKPASSSSGDHKKSHKRWKNTFAPPSANKNLNEVIKSTKGSVVEVTVAWRERIVNSYHYTGKKDVFVGVDKSADITLPFPIQGKRAFQLVSVGPQAVVFFSDEMTGELVSGNNVTNLSDLVKQNKVVRGPNGYALALNQGDVVRIGLQSDLISLYIRYVPEAPKPLVAPLLDLTASEVTGIILALVISSLFGLYMVVYKPEIPEQAKEELEPERKAIFVYTPPPPPPPVEEKVEPPPPPPPPPPPKPPKIVKVDDMKQSTKSQKAQTPDPGKAGSAAGGGKSAALGRDKGGAINTKSNGANMASEPKPRDVSKTGLLGVFGSKGTQSKLNQAYSGSGELQGLAATATGQAGMNEDRPGDNLGARLKSSGTGGKGTGTVGIGNVGTSGRGSGNYGYGTGGIGEKGRATINASGEEAEVTGSIDKEGIRRVVQQNLNQIRACYDQALQRNPDLYGKIVIQWDIGEQGRVLRAGVERSDLPRSVGDCIVRRLREWRFPEPPPDMIGQVSYPFVFTAQ